MIDADRKPSMPSFPLLDDAYADEHPHEKSLGYYVTFGYRLATGSDLPDAVTKSICSAAKRIDASMIVLDDIIDESPDRAGRASLFHAVGVKRALVEAIVTHCDAVADLRRVMIMTELPDSRQLEILDRLNELMHCIYRGQRMDLEARAQPSPSPDMIPEMIAQYFHLLLFATSSHVRTGLEVGQLLADRAVEPQVSAAADAIGIIRQVCDDISDYFCDHHQPFGDFKSHLNRLPELLFLQEGGDRKQVLDALDAGRFDEAREMVLTPVVRKKIYWYCEQEREKVRDLEGGTFDLAALLQDFDDVLSR